MDLRCIRTKKNGLMIFIQKTDTSLVSIALSQGRTNFSKCENLKSVLLLGASPPGPLTGHCPCTPLGGWAAPRPLAWWGALSPQCQ